MNSVDQQTPPPAADPAKWRSLALAAIVHLLLIGALFFGVQWKSKAPKSVEVEVWRSAPAPALPIKTEAATEATKEPKPEVKPKVKPEPKPAPPPPPKPEVKPDIALKDDKKPKELPRKEEVKEPPKKEPAKPKEAPRKEEPKEQPPPKKEPPKAKEAPKKEEPKPQAERRPSFEDELAREKAQIEKQKAAQEAKQQAAERAAEKAAQDQRLRAQAEARQLKQLQAEQAAVERARGLAEYMDKVRGKIRGNIALPPGIQGNPESEFEVTQLPSGDVLDVKVRRSSGNAALDAAVERAIRRSSPLPKPPQPELFERVLKIPYRPRDD